MTTNEEYEVLMKLGTSIKEIYFSEIPDPSLLEPLQEGKVNQTMSQSISDEIIFHFPLDRVVNSIQEFTEAGNVPNIHSINFDTDLFTDWAELDTLPNLVNLVLTCTNRQADQMDTRDLDNMCRALSDLGNLETLTFDIEQMQDQPKDQIKKAIKSTYFTKNIDVKYMTMSGKKKKKGKSFS